jgi:hypothetical protein
MARQQHPRRIRIRWSASAKTGPEPPLSDQAVDDHPAGGARTGRPHGFKERAIAVLFALVILLTVADAVADAGAYRALRARGVVTTATVVDAGRKGRTFGHSTLRVRYRDGTGKEWDQDVYPIEHQLEGAQVRVVYDPEDPRVVEAADLDSVLVQLGFTAVWVLLGSLLVLQAFIPRGFPGLGRLFWTLAVVWIFLWFMDLVRI